MHDPAVRSPLRLPIVAALLLAPSLTACAAEDPSPAPPLPEPAVGLPAPTEEETERTAVFAGGCFWCIEAVFEQLEGVQSTVSGYAGGRAETASYREVARGRTRHAEAVKLTYDPHRIRYRQLLRVFFLSHDPTQGDGQHPDDGPQYRPAVFYADDDEKQAAAAYIAQLGEAEVFEAPIATGLEKLTGFYPAETYHQDFAEKNPRHPYVLRWAKPKLTKLRKFAPDLVEKAGEKPAADPPAGRVEKTRAQWREQLTGAEFRVLREAGTERPFSSPLNQVQEPGTFLCAGCELALFETKTQFKSGTGWPSFNSPWQKYSSARDRAKSRLARRPKQAIPLCIVDAGRRREATLQPIEARRLLPRAVNAPIDPDHLIEREDRSHGMIRTEVLCARCDGHLGHLFHDGPEPTGLRYCINGVAMDFRPREKE